MPKTAQDKTAKTTFFKKRDLILIGVLLAIALIFWLVMRPSAGEPAGGGAPAVPVAVVTVGYSNTQVEYRIPLDEDAVYDIDEGAFPVHLEVVDGAIRFINAECPDHNCEGFGWLRRDLDWAACLPAGVMVIVEEPDVVADAGTQS